MRRVKEMLVEFFKKNISYEARMQSKGEDREITDRFAGFIERVNREIR